MANGKSVGWALLFNLLCPALFWKTGKWYINSQVLPLLGISADLPRVAHFVKTLGRFWVAAGLSRQNIHFSLVDQGPHHHASWLMCALCLAPKRMALGLGDLKLLSTLLLWFGDLPLHHQKRSHPKGQEGVGDNCTPVVLWFCYSLWPGRFYFFCIFHTASVCLEAVFKMIWTWHALYDALRFGAVSCPRGILGRSTQSSSNIVLIISIINY